MRIILIATLLATLCYPIGREVAFLHWWRSNPDVCAWRSALQDQYGETPSPNCPEYNYRAAWRNGATPQAVDGDTIPHWPSEYKSDSHPSRFIPRDGRLYDTKLERYTN